MADETTLTSGQTGPLLEVTPELEPEAAVAQGQAPESLAPSDEKENQIRRLKENLKGRQMEAERYRQRAEQLERERDQVMARFGQPQMIPQAEPSEEDLARSEQQYLLDGKFAELAQIRRYQTERAARMAEQRTAAMLGQAAFQAQGQQATARYLARLGVTDITSDMAKAVGARMQQMTQDPDYADLASNPNAMARLAAAEIRAMMAETSGAAKRKEREESSAEAATEPAGKGNGSPPGIAVRSNKMYFTKDEMKWIERDVKANRFKTLAESQKNWWDKLDPKIRSERQKTGSA